jgi:hypothetical protein
MFGSELIGSWTLLSQTICYSLPDFAKGATSELNDSAAPKKNARETV